MLKPIGFDPSSLGSQSREAADLASPLFDTRSKLQSAAPKNQGFFSMLWSYANWFFSKIFSCFFSQVETRNEADHEQTKQQIAALKKLYEAFNANVKLMSLADLRAWWKGELNGLNPEIVERLVELEKAKLELPGDGSRHACHLVIELQSMYIREKHIDPRDKEEGVPAHLLTLIEDLEETLPTE